MNRTGALAGPPAIVPESGKGTRSVPLDILGVIILTATIQSLFGVGVLLFGTPLLLVPG